MVSHYRSISDSVEYDRDDYIYYVDSPKRITDNDETDEMDCLNSDIDGENPLPDSPRCPICLNDMDDLEAVTLPCSGKHQFHLGCIERSFNFGSRVAGKIFSCPICRSEIPLYDIPPSINIFARGYVSTTSSSSSEDDAEAVPADVPSNADSSSSDENADYNPKLAVKNLMEEVRMRLSN